MDLKPFIIYEDEDIVALNKPAGIVVHNDGRTAEPSVSEWFVEAYPEAKTVGEPVTLANGKEIERPGIVHRLDRDTSGALLLAKTERGFARLKVQFQDREIEKVYHAFVYGAMEEDHGAIKFPIARSGTDFRKRTAVTSMPVLNDRMYASYREKGIVRDALTYYKVLKRTEESTLVEARPKTGRTHQIRVHLKALRHPVVADQLYARKMPPILGFERLALHAREIEFKDADGNPHVVKAPYPEDFLHAFKEIGFEPKG